MNWLKVGIAFLILSLFCNVISIGIDLFQSNAEAISYLNLVGVIVFGYALREIQEIKF